jgi:hypothetical protein
MASSTEVPPPTPSAQPEPVVAEDPTKTTPEEAEYTPHTSAIVAEVASMMNHADVQSILAIQAEMYVYYCYHLNNIP